MLPYIKNLVSVTTLTLFLGIPRLAMAMDVPVGFSLSPKSAPAGEGFKLWLQNKVWGCGYYFTRESVVVDSNRIYLSYVPNAIEPAPLPLLKQGSVTKSALSCAEPVFLDSANSTRKTRPSIEPSPSFSIPALKAGKYQVWATQMAECLYAQPKCKIAVMPEHIGVLEIIAPEVISYGTSPSQINSGKDFTLDLLSYQFNCATTFTMLSSSVSGNTISLNFLDQPTPGALCPAIYKPYGPSFKIKGLAAGSYNIKAHRLPPCMAQGCTVAPLGVLAGNLVVTDGEIARNEWYLAEKRVGVISGVQPMQLLNEKYGSCQTSFSNLNASVSSGRIYVSFTVETHPEYICIMDQRPFGPTFQLIAPLKPGAYPIFIHENLPCESVKPYCLTGIAPRASDTLYISSTNSITNGISSHTNAKAFFHGNRLNLVLPRDLGTGMDLSSAMSKKTPWQVDLLTLSGKLLQSQWVEVDGRHGGNISLESNSRVQRGMYFVRLTTPYAKRMTIPITAEN